MVHWLFVKYDSAAQGSNSSGVQHSARMRYGDLQSQHHYICMESCAFGTNFG